MEYRNLEFPCKFYVINNLEGIVKALILIGWDMIRKVGDATGEFSFDFDELKKRTVKKFHKMPPRLPTVPKMIYDFERTGDLIQTAQNYNVSINKSYGAILEGKSEGWMHDVNPYWYDNLIIYHTYLGQEIDSLKAEIKEEGLTRERKKRLTGLKSKFKSAGSVIKKGSVKAGKFTGEKIKAGSKRIGKKTSKLALDFNLLKGSFKADGKFAHERTYKTAREITPEDLAIAGGEIVDWLETKIKGIELMPLRCTDRFCKIVIKSTQKPRERKVWTFNGHVKLIFMDSMSFKLDINIQYSSGFRASELARPIIKNLVFSINEGIDDLI